MEIITIEVTDEKAYQLLEDMEQLKLIKLKVRGNGISELPKKIKSPMTDTEIETHLSKLRNEWQRDI